MFWKRFFTFQFILLLILLTSCQDINGKVETSPDRTPDSALLPSITPPLQPPLSTLPPEASPTGPVTTAQPTSTPDPQQGRPNYHFEVELDLLARSLKVNEGIGYTNNTGEEISTLLLVIPPNQHPGVFSLSKISQQDGAAIQDFRWEGPNLLINLPARLLPGQKSDVVIAYQLNLPGEAAVLGYSGSVINLGDWYPYIPPYLKNTGWIYHPPATVGENLVYPLADFEINLRLTHASPGEVVASSLLLKAAGDTFTGSTTSRNITFSLSQDYRLLQKKVGSTAVEVYVFSQHLAEGQAALDVIEKSLTLYSRLFAAYPHPLLTMVEGAFPDGMEYDGFFFLGSEYFYSYPGSPRSYLIALTAHETAHQWWFGLVGNDQAAEPWLDEALCTYSELIFYENTYPDLIGWWWDYRVYRYIPTGPVDSSIYDYREFRPYVNAVYLNGARFLDEVRQKIGDEAFFAALHGEASQYSGKIITAAEFFKLFPDRFQPDLVAIKARYFK